MSNKILENPKKPYVPDSHFPTYKRIKIALIENDINERYLSDKLGLTLAHVNQVIRGLSNNAVTRAKIEDALGEQFWSEEN